jgi:hypothetical protein
MKLDPEIVSSIVQDVTRAIVECQTGSSPSARDLSASPARK